MSLLARKYNRKYCLLSVSMIRPPASNRTFKSYTCNVFLYDTTVRRSAFTGAVASDTVLKPESGNSRFYSEFLFLFFTPPSPACNLSAPWCIVWKWLIRRPTSFFVRNVCGITPFPSKQSKKIIADSTSHESRKVTVVCASNAPLSPSDQPRKSGTFQPFARSLRW